MNRDRWQVIEHILDEALNFDSQTKQLLFIEQACKGDQRLYREVRLLMRAIRDADKIKFME